jgi:hypothetical protein
MDSIFILIAIVVALCYGMTVGFLIGITKGLSWGGFFHNNKPPIFLILCRVTSIVLLLSAIGSTLYSLHFISNSFTTNATVITKWTYTMSHERFFRHNTIYHYNNRSGKMFTNLWHPEDLWQYQGSHNIPIRYLKDAPQESRIDSFSHQWLPPILLSFSSMLFAGIGIAWQWWRNRKHRSAKKPRLVR